MAKLSRIALVDGATLTVPQYVNRTESGWQVRVRGVPSQHFADAHFGCAKQALAEAAQAVPPLLRAREVQPKN